MGAAYATGNDQTVKEFIDHGAAIGVQVKEARYRVWNNEALLLCHTAGSPLLFSTLFLSLSATIVYGHIGLLTLVNVSQDNGYRRVLDVEEGDELKLICKPCQILNLEHEYMDLSRAYDILVLGVFNRGKAKFWATFVADEEGSEPKLFLRISWLPALGLPGIEYKWFSTSVTLPLTFDRPSGCMFVVQNGVGPTLPPQALVNPPSL